MKNKSIRIASIFLFVTLLLCTVALSGCEKKSVFEEVASWRSDEIQLEITETSKKYTVTAEGKTYSVTLLSYYVKTEKCWYYCFYDRDKIGEKGLYGEAFAKSAMWAFEASKKGKTLTLTVLHDYAYARGESQTDHKGKVYTLQRVK